MPAPLNPIDDTSSDEAQTPTAKPEQIRVSLDRVLQSEAFQGSERLREFLTYVVTQRLEDSSRKIPAKAIAHDLYGRSLGSGADNVNVVRVDAGRLRRKLAEYYAGPGHADPVIIHVDSGGYTPRFEVRTAPQPNPAPAHLEEQMPRRIGLAIAMLVLLATFGAGLAIGYLFAPASEIVDAPMRNPDPDQASPEQQLERRALMAKSPSSLQAVTLSQQARNLIFPIFELEQLELTLAMFRQAIKKDGGYFGGYAGAAQSLATMAMLAPDGSTRNDLLQEARKMLDTAVELAPTDAWTQSAWAWLAYAGGDIAKAREHAEIAIGLSPESDNVLDFYALFMLCIGEFKAVTSVVEPIRVRDPMTGLDAKKAFLGAAYFHLGRYDDSISTLEMGIETGAPISAATLAYLTASFQAQGNTNEARRHSQDLKKNWPEFRLNESLGRLYADPDQTAAIRNFLLDAGWNDP